MVPMLFHLVEGWVFACLPYSLMQLFVQILIHVSKGIHAFILLIKVLFEFFVVLLKTFLLDLHLIDSGKELSSPLFSLS